MSRADNPSVGHSDDVFPNKLGRISLVIGPMFAGKTEELIRNAGRARAAQLPYVFVRPLCDTRHAELQSHGETLARGRVARGNALADCDVQDARVVLVDEGQFFPDLALQCSRWAREGRQVFVAALDGTAERDPFPAVAALLPLCDSVCKLRAICMLCRRRDAPFTKRMGAPPATSTTVDIGGSDKYAAACRACWR